MKNNNGTVYLLHFSEPYKHARHYLGFAMNLKRRLKRHSEGRGARLIEVIQSVGITYELARVWKGKDRHFERRLKNWNGSSRLCPTCKEERRRWA